MWRVENEVFSKFGDLGGDFYKDTHEPKLFGMHIGSVLSGFEAGNAKNDKMPNRIALEESEMTFFEGWRSWRGLYKNTYEPKLFGMYIGSVLSGLEAGSVNNDREMPNQDCDRALEGSKLRFSEVADLEGNFYKETHEA